MFIYVHFVLFCSTTKYQRSMRHANIKVWFKRKYRFKTRFLFVQYMIRFLGETEVNSPDALLDASSSFFVMPYINLLRGSEMRTNYFRTIQGIFKSQLLRYFIIYEYFYHIRIFLILQWYGYNRNPSSRYIYTHIFIYIIMFIGTRTISNGCEEALWIREIGQLPPSDNSCVSRQKPKPYDHT